MKHPFWILNLGLLSLVLFAFVFVYFSTITIPSRQSIEPEPIAPQKELKVAINIKKIYEDDLFGTFIKDQPQARQIDIVVPFPEPPVQEKIVAPKKVEPEFLDPLQITLKGIIVVGSNDGKNRAIIQEDKTKKETTYKVGDTIQDAQLIRIFKNKIILLRLNGQQEVLYLREQDARLDPAYTLLNEWDVVVKKVDEHNYTINPEVFAQRVTNLAQFIDILNATTAYQQGKSVGLSIGQLTAGSLGAMLGLSKGDIIININDIPTQTTDQQLAIYKNITNLDLDDTITIKLIRRNREVALVYTLKDFSTVIKNEATPEQEQKKEKEESETGETTAFFQKRNNENSRNQHHAFTPTINKIRRSDHQMMLEKSKSFTQHDS